MRKCTIAVLLVVAACGGSDKATGPTNISGAWQYSDGVSNGQLSVSCTSNAAVNISQNGATFTGTISSGSQNCTGPGGTFSSSLAGLTIGGGQINGSSVTFTDGGGCSYTGTISGNPSNRISGNETCVVPFSGTNYTFTGTWQATR
jgi:hypothetical protein